MILLFLLVVIAVQILMAADWAARRSSAHG